MKKRLLCLLLAVSLVATGCSFGGSKGPDTETSEDEKPKKQHVSERGDKGKDKGPAPKQEETGLLKILNTSYAATSLDEEYEAPMYSLDDDHVFEYENVNKELGSHGYDVFRVHTRSDLSDSYGIAKVEYDYDTAKLTVAPNNGILYTTTGSTTVKGSWGSYNKLYLAQYYDLKTGKELDSPIVTPFSIKHDLANPLIKQSVGEGNLWTLSWEPVKGATKYVVYSTFHDDGTSVSKQCETTDTTITVSDLDSQKRSDSYFDALQSDLQALGYDIGTDDDFYLNSKLQGVLDYFVVVAFDENGNQSGISNVIDVNDIAAMLPYKIEHTVVETDITSISDVPAYADIRMVDGSTKQMLINYHGAQTLIYPDDPECIGIKAHIANTSFSSFLIKIHGMEYDDFVEQASEITARQDSLDVTNGSETVNVVLPSSPETNGVEESDEEAEERADELGLLDGEHHSEELLAEGNSDEDEYQFEEDDPYEVEEDEGFDEEEPSFDEDEEFEEDEPPVIDEEPDFEEEDPVINEPDDQRRNPVNKGKQNMTTDVDASKLVVIPDSDGMTTYDLYLEAVALADERLAQIPDIYDVIYADSKLEAWISYALVAQLDVIPVPVAVYPEAANEDYLSQVFMEAYIQNPTSGLLTAIGMSYSMESLIPYYAEDADTRLYKTAKELEAAKQVAAGLSDGEREAIFEINNYLCRLGTYDYDSTATDLSTANISEQFIDAHTPYGILLNGYGVCESYSEAFMLIARFAGIEALAERGYLDGGAHEWNRVKVNGSWAVVDVTNNDIDFTDIPLNAILNVTDSQISANFVPDGEAFMAYLPANDESNEYYNVKGAYTSSVNEAAKIVAAQYKQNGFAQIRLTFTPSESDIYEMIDAAYDASGIFPSSYAYMFGILVIM